MGDGRVAELREQLDQCAPQPLVHGVVVFVRRAHAAGEVVRGAATAERDPPVGGALAVDHQPAGVAERRPVGQPDRVEHVGRQRLGGDHQRVDRHQRAAQAGELGSERLGGPHAEPRPHALPVGPDAMALDVLDRRVLVDHHAAPLDRGGQPDARGAPDPAPRSVRVNDAPWTSLIPTRSRVVVGVEPAHVVVTEAEGVVFAHLALHARRLRRAAGHVQRATLGEPAVDRLGGDHAAHLVDRGVHRQLDPPGSRPPVVGGDRPPGSSAAAPSTIRRCARWRRTRPPRPRARRCATPAGARPGSTPSTTR